MTEVSAETAERALRPREERESARALSVLHVLAPAEFGGLESVLRLLATGTRGRGHAVHVALVLERESDGAALSEALEGADVGVTRLVLPGRAYLAERHAIAGLCRRVGADVVHTHGYRPDVVDSGVAHRLGAATVTTAHGFVGGDRRNKLYEWLQRRAMRRFDAVVAVSRQLREQLVASGVAPERIELVPNAYAPGEHGLAAAVARQRLGATPDDVLLGFVGRLTPEKGADILLDALEYLGDLPILAAIIGDGADRPTLEARARARGLASRIHWHGRIPEAGGLFPGFDLFVLSSRTEGTPMVLFEAMAAGTPIVAANVGGVPDVVSEREAMLVPVEEAMELAAAIRKVIDDPAAARRRAEAARARLLTEYGVEPWLERYERIYYEAVQRARRR